MARCCETCMADLAAGNEQRRPSRAWVAALQPLQTTRYHIDMRSSAWQNTHGKRTITHNQVSRTLGEEEPDAP